MANEFIARNGLISQNNTTITGSLNVTGGVTGSISSASYALTASYAMNGGGGGNSIFTYTGSAVISGSLEVKNPLLPIPSGSIFAPTNSPTSLYVSSSVSQSTSFNITNSNINVEYIGEFESNMSAINTTFYIIAYSNQYNSATSSLNVTDDGLGIISRYLTFSTASVQSPATITGYDLYAIDNFSSIFYKLSSFIGNGPILPNLDISSFPYVGGPWPTTSSIPNLPNNPVPVYNTFNKVGIGKSSSLNGVLDINGNTIITGSLIVTNNTTGSLLGTASFASTSSYLNTLNQNVFITGSFAITGSTITTGSVIENTRALSIASNTASLNLNSGNFFTLQLVPNTNTFINPSNITPGQTTTLLISTTGSATVSFPSTVLQISRSSYIPTPTSGLDLISMISFDTSSLYLVYTKNLK